MSFDPKLTVYTFRNRPELGNNDSSNRYLFRQMTAQANENLIKDSVLFMDVFTKFIQTLDKKEMYADEKAKKVMTANQPDIDKEDVDTKIVPHSDKFIIEGAMEGGPYGRHRKKRARLDKANKSEVGEDDAITDNFYFLIYVPPAENKITLLIQSFSSDTIDSVMVNFIKSFFFVNGIFKVPVVRKYIPASVIESFKIHSTVSDFIYTTEVPGSTLLEPTSKIVGKQFKISVKITPLDGELTVEDFEESVESISQNAIGHGKKKKHLFDFRKKKANLRDGQTGKPSLFDIGSDFEIQPGIQLTKFVPFKNEQIDFNLIKIFCFDLLEEIKPAIYPQNAIQIN